MQLDTALVPEKGQVATLDLGIATITILIILSITVIHSTLALGDTLEKRENIEMKKKLYYASESLVTTPGTPLDWQENLEELNRLGLTKYEQSRAVHHVLSEEKINKMRELPLHRIKRALNLQDYKINIKIQRIEGVEVLERGEISRGRQITRIVLYEGDKHVLKIKAK